MEDFQGRLLAIGQRPARYGFRDVLMKTKALELHRYWTTRDRAANVRLFRVAAAILAAVDAGVFPPRVGWHCADCPVRSRCWAWGSG